MIKNLEFMRHSMRFNIMEGNKYAATVSASYGYDVLDMHYYMVSADSKDLCHFLLDKVQIDERFQGV